MSVMFNMIRVDEEQVECTRNVASIDVMVENDICSVHPMLCYVRGPRSQVQNNLGRVPCDYCQNFAF